MTPLKGVTTTGQGSREASEAKPESATELKAPPLSEDRIAELRRVATEAVEAKRFVDCPIWSAIQGDAVLALLDDNARLRLLADKYLGMLAAEEDRATSAEAERDALAKALEEIVTDCSMTREQFIMEGPAFACRQVEKAATKAREALRRAAEAHAGEGKP